VREKHADAATRVLGAMELLKQHQIAKAREAAQEGVDDGVVSALMVASYADLSIGKSQRAHDEAEQAAMKAPGIASVNLLRSLTEPDSVEARHELVQALEANPMMVEAYVERAFEAMVGRDKDRFQAADALIDFALKLDPNSSLALMAKATSFIVQKRPNEAEPVLAQLQQTENDAPDVHLALALTDSLLDHENKITAELNMVKSLNPDFWPDATVPSASQLLVKVYRFRHSPVISPAALYPPQ